MSLPAGEGYRLLTELPDHQGRQREQGSRNGPLGKSRGRVEAPPGNGADPFRQGPHELRSRSYAARRAGQEVSESGRRVGLVLGFSISKPLYRSVDSGGAPIPRVHHDTSKGISAGCARSRNHEAGHDPYASSQLRDSSHRKRI